MSGELFLNSQSDYDGELARKILADEVRAALWPHVAFIRQQIGNWVENHRTPVDLIPLPTRTLTLAEKCAALAAFHDSVGEGEPFWASKEQDQGTDDDGSRPTSVAEYLNLVPWLALSSAAGELVPRPKDPLRTLLGNVVDVLATEVSGRTSRSPEPTRSTNQYALGANTVNTSMAMSELSRVADQLRPLLGSSTPTIGLFSWTQELTGFAGEQHRTMSHADTAGALGGKPQNIVWCGAETWRQPEPLHDEHGDAITKLFVGSDGKPAMLHGQPIVLAQLSPIEYRGIVAVDLNHSADLRFLSSELHTGFSGGVKINVLKHLHAAGEVLAKSRRDHCTMGCDISTSLSHKRRRAARGVVQRHVDSARARHSDRRPCEAVLALEGEWSETL